MGRSDEHNFTLTVSNTPPKILTTNVVTTKQDALYAVDYASSDDGNGPSHGTLTRTRAPGSP